MNRTKQSGWVLCRKLIIVLVACLGGCAPTTKIQPLSEQAAPERFQNVAVGEISAKDAQWNAYSAQLRGNLVVALIKTGMFVRVMDPAPQPLPPSTVFVTGQVTEADPGGPNAPYLGWGPLGAHLTVEFQLIDAKGTAVGRFSAGARFEWNSTFMTFTGFDDLIHNIGRDAAAAIARWCTTGRLE